MLNLTTANNALTLHSNSNYITAQDIEQLLQNVHGTTFASITYVTKVTTAAAHKAKNIVKVTVASVQLFNNLNAFTSVYANAVKRTASKIGDNTQAEIDAFKVQENWFEHTSCYSVVQHKTKLDQFYLYAIYNKAESLLYIDNVLATKEEVAAYLTPAAAKAMLEPEVTTYNVANDITHSVVVRVVALNNIVSIAATKQVVTV